MRRKTIAVLFGGCSSEYDVSLQSACEVIENIDREKYEIVMLGITRDGEWVKYDGPAGQIKDDTWRRHPSCIPAVISPDRQTHGLLVTEKGGTVSVYIDAAFPVLHGKNGEDGTLQGLLTMAGIPIIGCGVLSSAVCMDKDIAHRLVQAAGIKTTPSAVVTASMREHDIMKAADGLKYPLFVKPANAGSSFGISQAADSSQLLEAVHNAFGHDRKVVIEQTVEGFEVGCAVLGTDALIVGAVDEIELRSGFFDYTEKYTLQTSKIHMPARISEETAARVKQAAVIIYRALECSGFARVDMFLTPQGDIVFNEVNTIPGFTAHSRYPGMLRGIGMSFADVVNTLIGQAVPT